MFSIYPAMQIQAFTNFGPNATRGVYSWNALILLGLITGSPLKAGFSPRESERGAYNDRSCYHINVKGDLCAVPAGYIYPGTNRVVTPTARWLTPWNYARYRLGAADTDEVILPGISGSQIREFREAPYLNSVIWAHKWYMDWWWEGYALHFQLHTTVTVESSGVTTHGGTYTIYQFNTDPSCGRPTQCRTGSRGGYPFVAPSLSSWSTFPSTTLSARPPYDDAALNKSISTLLTYASGIADEVAKQPVEDTFRHLVLEASQNARALDINTIAFIRDARKLFNDIHTIREIFRRGKLDGRDIADLYLSYRYGARLTVLDSIKVANALVRRATAAKQKFSICRARTAGVCSVSVPGLGDLTGDVSFNLKLYYQPLDNLLVSALRKCYEWDIWPDLSNVWDLIPYSFVVDWFIGIDDILEQVDAITYYYTLEVLSCITTAKTTFTSLPTSRIVTPGYPTILGTWETSIYSRVVRRTCPVPRMTFESPGQFRNYAEAAALLVQRTKK